MAGQDEGDVPEAGQPELAQPAGPRPGPPPAPWRAGLDPDRRRQARRPGDHQRQTLHTLTVASVVLAVGLNAALFVQTGISQVSVGTADSQILAFIQAIFPGAAPRSPSQSPSPAAGRPIATTGGS
jgi:hypothetical protein